jgi:trimeric autotransporter adhesin
MPATGNAQAGPSSATGPPGGDHRRLGHGRRPRSGAAPHGPPDVGAVAREAVISFLRDASNATADRQAGRAVPAAAPGPEAAPRDAIFPASPVAARPVTASPVAAESVAVRAAAMSVAALDRIEAAAAKVETDIAAAHRAYAELQAGAGAAAQAAVDAAQSALASAGVAVEAERQVKISLRQVRQYVVVTTVLLAVVIIVLALVTTNVH